MTAVSAGAGPAAVGRPSRLRTGPVLLIYFHIAVCCISLIYVAHFYGYAGFLQFDETRVYEAILNIVPFAAVSLLFTFNRFSFGYILGFYFYTMVLGFLWVVEFTRFNYSRETASFSAIASAIAFLLPALLITAPLPRRYALSRRAFKFLLFSIVASGAAVGIVGALYNFQFVGLEDIYTLRATLDLPKALDYAIGITSNTTLPFAFACFVIRRQYWWAAATILLLLMLYPVTLSKVVLFAPLWLVVLAVLSAMFEARMTVVVSLLLPISVGVALAMLYQDGSVSHDQIIQYIGTVNFRMVAIPSIALDYYTNFFATHDLTYFCQISVLKRLIDCPYSDQLSIVMSKEYQLGNFNASLFATEGIASVGLLLAPFAVLICGFVLAIGNRVSSDLPPRFVLVSSAVISQSLLNVPLSTSLLTNGGIVLFVLWYLVPREIFEQGRAGLQKPGVRGARFVDTGRP
jgi:hypothetical protein